MDGKLTTKLVRAGNLAAEVDVRLIEAPSEGWAPYISVTDARRLDDAREALKRGDIAAAARLGRVYRLEPV
jgi:hypothetical protein